MNCLAFERLLDEGEPERLDVTALAHAAECARCARALARSRSLESALARHFSSTVAAGDELPLGFTDRVLRRVERVEARGVRWLTLPDALPWWVRAAAEPGVALAIGLAALLLWRGDALLDSARAWLPGLERHPLQLGALLDVTHLGVLAGALANAFVPAPDAHWSVVAAMALGVAPVFALVGFGLWRMGERFADAAATMVLR